jgi:hypothetical protein
MRESLMSLPRFSGEDFDLSLVMHPQHIQLNPPQTEIFIHPALNSDGFRPGEPKRLEMLLK